MIWNKLLGEFIDIIEWTDDSNDTLVYRFERYGNEIKNGAKLTVREGQTAIFVNEGELADVFAPGMYDLETQNLPILSTLQGWKYGFSSPFKAEVYFVSTRRFTDLKWGTKNPIMLRDPEFGPVRLRAFGTYTMQATDAPALIREIVGTDGHFTIDEITNQLRNLIVSRFANIVGGSRIPVLDLAANYDDLGKFVADRIRPEFQAYGLDIPTLLIENISLPPAVEEALDKRTSMGVIGDLSRYTQYQTAEAITKAADNPGGMAAGGMGMGMGFAMANQMAQTMGAQQQQQPQAGPAAAAPPPLPPQVSYYIAVNGQQAGPFDMNALRGEHQAGRLTPDTLVWSQGMAGWTRAQEVAALGGLFQAGPPPLPGAA
ncbi:MAG: SPFH domain-containing protein [Pseudomonadota bacterium]